MFPEGKAPFPPGSPGEETPQPSTPWWEDAAVIVAIASLWPVFLNWPGRHWMYLLYAAAAIMIIIMVRRIRRLNKLTRDHKNKGTGQFPFGQGRPPISWQDHKEKNEL